MRVELAVLAILCAAPLARAHADDDARRYDPRALAVYDEGKRLYDRKEYGPALAKFDEAARLESTAARWQYNRGLALKKLGRQAEAKGAFVKAFALDPTYKRLESDQKLREMGYPALQVGVPLPQPIAPKPDAPASRRLLAPGAGARRCDADSDCQAWQGCDGAHCADLACAAPVECPTGTDCSGGRCTPKAVRGEAPPKPSSIDWKPRPEPEPSRGFGFVVGLFVVFAVVVGGLFLLLRTRAAPAAPSRPAMDPAAQAALRGRLAAIQKSLVALEHGFAAGEDPEARALLEQATGDARDLERDLSYTLHAGDEASLAPRLAAVEQAVSQAFGKLEARFGPGVRTAQGPRVACFFCAKPLANDTVRRQVTLREKGADTPVLSCPTCAAEAEAGRVPQMTPIRPATSPTPEVSSAPSSGSSTGAFPSGSSPSPPRAGWCSPPWRASRWPTPSISTAPGRPSSPRRRRMRWRAAAPIATGGTTARCRATPSTR
jgi:hypothetical protein